MPRIITTIAAVAIIAFAIGFNIVRYPIVWEMVGPPAHLTQESNNAETPKSSQTTQSTDSITVLSAEKINLSHQINRTLSEPSARGSTQPATDMLVGTQPSQNSQSQLSAMQSVNSPTLVPVPSNLFIVNGAQSTEPYPAVRRLPPVDQAAPISPGRYAAEYPQSPIPIYPSTGIK